jgi:hypothetical protein
MHRPLPLLLVLLIVQAMTGCGPSVSSKDMGTIIDKIPHVQGADQPYELPKVITPTAEDAIPNPQVEEGTKADQTEGEKEVKKEAESEQQALPDNTNSPRPTPAQRRP